MFCLKPGETLKIPSKAYDAIASKVKIISQASAERNIHFFQSNPNSKAIFLR